MAGCTARSLTARRTWLVPACQRRGGYLTSGAGPATCLADWPSAPRRLRVLAGIGATPATIEVARAAAATSFDHWADQRAGLAECARVLAPGGCLVLADLFSVLLLPTLLAGRRGKARTRRRAAHLLTVAGLHSPHWHRLYAVIIQAVTATK